MSQGRDAGKWRDRRPAPFHAGLASEPRRLGGSAARQACLRGLLTLGRLAPAMRYTRMSLRRNLSHAAEVNTTM
jgi:hypothetical protein